MHRLSWLCLLIALSACSPDKKGTSASADGVGKLPPSPYAGVYMGKEDALTFRATGKIDPEACKKALEQDYIVGNTLIINDAGEARSYYPQWNLTKEPAVSFTVDVAGTVTYPAEKPEDRIPDDATVKAKLAEGMLSITARYQNETSPVQEFAVSSKDEVLKYFKYQEENCTKKKQ